MSDIRKWINIVSESSLEPGNAVKLADNYGGGIGEFAGLSSDGTSAFVNVKGQRQEVPVSSLEKVLAAHGNYQDNPTNIIVPSELNVGDRVRIEGLFGASIGPGYGIFMAYSTDGCSAICTVDSEERSFPVDLVYPADENKQKQDFNSTGSDGSQSPVANHGKDKQMNGMDQMSAWMRSVEESETALPKQDTETLDEQGCACDQYDCTVCYPVTEDEYFSHDNEETEELTELDIDNSEHWDDEEVNDTEDDSAIIDMGDEEDFTVSGPRDQTPVNDEIPAPNFSGASEDVSELIAKIEYIQDMGMSATERHYDIDKLMSLSPERIKGIYQSVTGSVVEGAEDADIVARPASVDVSSLIADILDATDRYSPDALMSLSTDRVEKIHQRFCGVDENCAGGVAMAAGGGRVQDETGVYEGSLDPAKVKALQGMSVEQAMAAASELISSSKTSEARKAKLLMNIQSSRTTDDVLRLMYNVLLAGDGMSTVNSKWQKKFGEAIDKNDTQTPDMFDESEGHEKNFRINSELAAYIMNGDASGVDPEDQRLVDQFVSSMGQGHWNLDGNEVYDCECCLTGVSNRCMNMTFVKDDSLSRLKELAGLK